jgi:hypothetical protein
MEKIDLRKSSPTLYAPPRDDFVLLKVPELTFVKIDGKGDPNTAAEYEEALQWLYGVSFWMKGLAKEAGKDYVVPPLEGLWWADSPKAFTANKRDKWRWTMMIPVPDGRVGKKEYNAAVKRSEKKLGEPPETLRLEPYEEGLSVQILHVGSYAEEAPTIKRLHETFLPQNGLKENGPHHEIYLSDPRRTAPAKLKTILRQPVKRK